MSALNVRFYSEALENNFESGVQGRPVKYMADMVRIEIPGNRLSVIDTLASQHHKQQYPLEWARYLQEKDTGTSETQGTLLTDWSLLTKAQAIELRHYHFHTVEQIASSSDAQIGAIGMLAGMSPASLRDKAKAFLDHAKSAAPAMAMTSELEKRDAEIAELKAHMARQDAQVASLIAAKSKGGRPPKAASA